MEGWTLAVCEYNRVMIQLKHQSLQNSYSEAIICPVFHDSPFPEYLETVLQSANSPDSTLISQIKPNTVRDFSCYELAASRLICPMLPKTKSIDQSVQLLRTALEVCSSLGCSSASLPVAKLDTTLEKSSELTLESIELYILGQLSSPGCLKEINVCCSSFQELCALNEASKFRMTRYSSFVCIGMPEELLDSHRYCYECFSINPAESNHEEKHLGS